MTFFKKTTAPRRKSIAIRVGCLAWLHPHDTARLRPRLGQPQ